MWLVCFFKQNTGYEMRISDWGSDVCSSDLEQRLAAGQARTGAGPGEVGVGRLRGREGVGLVLEAAEGDACHGRPDRQSVVSGKSVSVSVDLGGRRIIKKKN